MCLRCPMHWRWCGNRTYQFNREKLYLSALSLTGTRHRFALKFTKGGSGSWRDPWHGQGLGWLVRRECDLEQADENRWDVDRVASERFGLYFDGKPKVPSLTLNLTQPLLRGAGADIHRSAYTG